MKKLLFIIVISAAGFATLSSFVGKNSTQEPTEILNILTDKTDTVHVFGNCGMCKARIETAAKSVVGVKTAVWEVKSKILTVSYDDSKTSLKQIEEKIAHAGHDTRDVKADSKVYDKLPGCCMYERDVKENTSHKH